MGAIANWAFSQFNVFINESQANSLVLELQEQLVAISVSKDLVIRLFTINAVEVVAIFTAIIIIEERYTVSI